MIPNGQRKSRRPRRVWTRLTMSKSTKSLTPSCCNPLKKESRRRKAISCGSKVFESYVEENAIHGSKLFWTKAGTVTFDGCSIPSALPCCDWYGLRLVRCLWVNWPKEKFDL